MDENIMLIAQRIKALRDIAGESKEEVAKVLEIPVKDYENYESGKTDISVSFLYELAAHFNVELTAILTGHEPHMKSFSLVRKGTAPNIERTKEYSYRDLAYNFKHKRMEIFEVQAEPRSGDKPGHLNSHPGQEFNYCLEGSMKIIIGSNEMTLNPGDSLYFDSGLPHAMIALNNKPAKFIAVIL
ncbi:MAG: helix-turn-helix transcriptional regulator [Spirochaetes bacterium]|nr:helix-turn-helix transcriptional regulator [Spirochaetota bacterium]